MKRKIIISLIMASVLIFLFTIFTYSNQYNFRKTNWGMSKEQVKAIENKKSDGENDNILYYKVEISKDNFACFYYFLEDKLYQAAYVFDGKHTNKNDYIDDFKKFKEILIKKYGKPKTDKVIWKNDLFKDEKQNWGTAISVGHLVYTASWKTTTTEIILLLFGDNYEINLGIKYESKKLREWADKIIEEKAKNSF